MKTGIIYWPRFISKRSGDSSGQGERTNVEATKTSGGGGCQSVIKKTMDCNIFS